VSARCLLIQKRPRTRSLRRETGPLGTTCSCSSTRCCVCDALASVHACVEWIVLGCPLMQSMRRWVRGVAGGWLVLHLSLLVSVPTAICSTTSASAIGAECTCDHGDGQMCPMHHTRGKSTSPSDSRSCSCRSTSDPISAMAASLIGPAAVLAPSVSLFVPTTAGASALRFHPEPLEPSSVPDSPPPRV
jgi:hypothetical protein